MTMFEQRYLFELAEFAMAGSQTATLASVSRFPTSAPSAAHPVKIKRQWRCLLEEFSPA